MNRRKSNRLIYCRIYIVVYYLKARSYNFYGPNKEETRVFGDPFGCTLNQLLMKFEKWIRTLTSMTF